MRRRYCLPQWALAPLLVSGACDSASLESVTGRHVTVHWDSSERQLCGGTVEYADRALEIMAGTYGVDLAAQPAIDIFWTTNSSLPKSVCAGHGGACVVPFPNGTSYIVSPEVIYLHELTHAVRLAGAHAMLPSFFNEGVAVRWEIGWTDTSVGKDTYLGNIDYAWLRDVLSAGGRIDSDAYPDAGWLWSWLEAEHGAERMATFADQLGSFSSVDEIERAFAQTFGMSLEQATEVSRNQPLYMFDIPACAMMHLPTVVWDDEVDIDGPEHCADDHVVSSGGGGALYQVRIELPDTIPIYALTVDGESPSGVRLDSCTGTARAYESAPYFNAPRMAAPVRLHGTYIVTMMSASLTADGRVDFPRVRLERP